MNNKVKKEILGTWGIIMLGLLALQYVLGIATNLFVMFPQKKDAGQLWEFAWKQPPLAIHIILGIILIVVAIVILTQSIGQKNKLWITISAIGVLTILIAGISGAIFVQTQTAAYSFIMSISFSVAVIVYGWGVYASKN